LVAACVLLAVIRMMQLLDPTVVRFM